MKVERQLIASIVAAVLLASAHVFADMPAAQPTTAPSQFAVAQLDQLLAPIALYPDTLVAQILTAATYPSEIVQADRWLQDDNHRALTGEELTAALAQQPWDPSVKSLVPFPQILRMMAGNQSWTQQLGNAFLANQPAVMDAVQRLRHRAQAAGKLRSSPYQEVSSNGSIILIQSLAPDMVYVPVYDPYDAYGSWPYAGFPPYYFTGYFVVVAYSHGFGWSGFGINPVLWRWCHWGWHRHLLFIDRKRFNAINVHYPPVAYDTWHHDPAHRHGIPYRPDGAPLSAGLPGAPLTGTPNNNPAIVQPLPQVVQPLPQVVTPLPQVVTPLPQVVKPLPQVVKPLPQVVKPLPQVVKPLPQVVKPLPQVVQPLPQVVKPLPQVVQTLPQVVQPLPQVVQPLPQVVQPLSPVVRPLQPSPPGVNPPPAQPAMPPFHGQRMPHPPLQPHGPSPQAMPPAGSSAQPSAGAMSQRSFP